MNAILWLAVAANVISALANLGTRRRLKRDRGHDAEMLSAVANIVRCAGNGEYIDGAHADEIARELDTAATCALIRGGHLDKEMRAWMRQLRDTGINDGGGVDD